ncbi:hypothetical protein OUZ56_018137 [Daphnia magna]|uniref:Uncharacterized protein n=1 Tax=Daphnia magna TaxID=35525 RepID=A0ABQ9Z8C8_9CRUS|nr:hypothetical protein OUZ56_018137 [Daphnia magna]
MSRLTSDNDSLISAFSDVPEEKKINTKLTLEEKAEKSKRLDKATIPTQEAELHETSLMDEESSGNITHALEETESPSSSPVKETELRSHSFFLLFKRWQYSANCHCLLFTVSSKWRQKLISKRRKLESKATNLVKEINEKLLPGEELVTPEHFNKGVSPWDVANKAKCFVSGGFKTD